MRTVQVTTLAALGQRGGGAAALAAAAQLAATKPAALSGSAPRTSFSGAACELSAPPLSEGVASAKEAAALVDLLSPLVAKEPSEAARAAMLGAVGRWMPLLPAPAACASAFGKGLADKNAEVRRAHVGGVLSALEAGALAPTPPAGLVTILTSLAEPLVALIKPALKKAPSAGLPRADALCVLICIHEGGGSCPALEKAEKAEKVCSSAARTGCSSAAHTHTAC